MKTTLRHHDTIHVHYIRYFLSKCSMCSLARMRKETMLEFLGSPSSIRFSPPNRLCMADDTWTEEAADNACADENNWVYGTPEEDGDGDDVIGETGPSALPGKCVDIQGSRGNVELLPLPEMDVIVESGKLSDNLNPALSSFSWRRHFARLFWNHTLNQNYTSIYFRKPSMFVSSKIFEVLKITIRKKKKRVYVQSIITLFLADLF